MLHLRSVEIPRVPEHAEFPFTLPLIQNFQPLEFTAPVTFFVGENGSGKSTLMEALAVGAHMVTVGSVEAHRDQTLADVQGLARFIKLVWNKRTRKGFFLRAEDFFGWIKSQERMRVDLEDELKHIDGEYAGRSEHAKGLAKQAAAGQLAGMQRRYGDGLQNRSHGESFLDLFQARFVPGGLYMLDEPEVPLSPLRQLSLLSLLKQMVEEHEAQFIIATHSPILMAYPGAQILSLDQTPIVPIDYADLEHVNLTRDFLSDPESFLRHL